MTLFLAGGGSGEKSKETSAGAIVFRKDSGIKYLLLQSRKWNTWGFPKGHVESGETEEQAALRELEEETGLKGNLLKEFTESNTHTFELNKEQIEKKVIFFLLETKEDKVKLSEKEHVNYTWVDFEQALKLLSYEDLKNILRKANEFLTTK